MIIIFINAHVFLCLNIQFCTEPNMLVCTEIKYMNQNWEFRFKQFATFLHETDSLPIVECTPCSYVVG